MKSHSLRFYYSPVDNLAGTSHSVIDGNYLFSVKRSNSNSNFDTTPFTNNQAIYALTDAYKLFLPDINGMSMFNYQHYVAYDISPITRTGTESY